MSAKIDAQALATLCVDYPTAVAQRLGWLINFVSEHLGAHIDTDPLLQQVGNRIEPAPLIASLPRRGPLDARWNVYVNGEVEMDL